MYHYLAQDILKWPEYSAWPFLLALGGLAGLWLLAIFYMRLRYRGRAQWDAHWLVLRNYAARRGARGAELSLLREFFARLDAAEAQRAIMSRRLLHSLLHDFLFHETGHGEPIKVRLIDRLFPPAERDQSLEVKTPADLIPGEACGVEFAGEHHMAHAVKIKNDRILVSIPEWTGVGRDALLGEAATLYVYRAGVGGFRLVGRVVDVGKEALIFQFNGASTDIHFEGERHLMARLEFPLTLRPWEPGMAEGAELELTGVTERVSDRAVLFRLSDDSRFKAAAELQGRYDLWRMEFRPEPNYVFACRGKLIPSASPDRYIFKFVDAGEAARRVLFAVIKENNPEREHLS